MAGLLPAVFENAGLAVAVLDSEERIVVANAALCEMLGYSKDEVIGLSRRAFIHAEDVDAEPLLFRELIAGKRQRYATDKRFLHKSGRVRWGHATVTLLRDGGANYAIAIVEDITEKKSLEKASDEVRRAHERYALVARATNDVIWDWDAEQATIIWNDALRAMFGYERRRSTTACSGGTAISIPTIASASWPASTASSKKADRRGPTSTGSSAPMARSPRCWTVVTSRGRKMGRRSG